MPENSYNNEEEANLITDAIVVTSGSIVEIISSKNGNSKVIEGPDLVGDNKSDSNFTRLTSTSFSHKDARGKIAGGKARLLAADELLSKIEASGHKKPAVITLSRSTNNISQFSDAAVASLELRRKRNDLQIYEEDRSFDSFTELLSALKIGMDQGYNTLTLMTTRFQYPRLRAMLDSLYNLSDQDNLDQVNQMMKYNEWRLMNDFPHISFERKKELVQFFHDALDEIRKSKKIPHVNCLISEEILKGRSRHYKKLIEKLEADPEYRKQISTDIVAAEEWAQRDGDGTMKYAKLPVA